MRVTPESFTTALQAASHAQTAQTLGDRSKYVGASDIGQCPRKVILGKVVPAQHSLKTLLHFKRGHLTEEIVAEVLRDFEPERQRTISDEIPYCPLCEYVETEQRSSALCPRCQESMNLLPVKTHLDFLLPGNRIIEVKSTSLLEVQKSWEDQLAFQMLLLHRETGRHVEGALLMIDLGKAEMKAMNGYEYSPDKTLYLLNRAVKIWEGLNRASRQENLDGLLLDCEPSILCGYCQYLLTCHAMSGPELPEDIGAVLNNYYELSNQEKEVTTRKGILRDHILKILRPGTYQAQNLRIRLSNRSRTSTNMKQVEALLGELGQDISNFQSVSKYPVLDIKAA